MVQGNCKQCGKNFPPQKAGGSDKLYCSQKCGSIFTRYRRPQRIVVCKQCSTQFSTSRAVHFYCSDACNRKAHSIQVSSPYTDIIPTGTVGAISELLVSADLLKKGYAVFRAVSQSCSCDLAILKDGILLRVEVRTGYRIKNGTLSYPRKPKDEGRQDVWAIVIAGSEIVYEGL